MTEHRRQILDVARRTKAVCDKYNVPVIIDDRVDIALAMGADGVHLGQIDMPVPVARSLLPPGTIIGKTCNTPGHVRIAIAEGADYVGVGPVWGTQTKKVEHPVVGPRGIGEMIQVLAGTDVKSVAIGMFVPIRYTTSLMRCGSGYQLDKCPALPLGLSLVQRAPAGRHRRRE